MNILYKLIDKLKTYGVKETLFLLRNRIHRDTESLMQKTVLFLFKKRKLENAIILESHNDFDSNGGAVYDYLLRHRYNETCKIIWLLRNDVPENLPANVKAYRMNRLSWAKTYYRCMAKYILCCHVMLESLRDDQISVYMTHGAVALKNVKGKLYFPDRITYCLYPSRFLEEIFSGQMSLPHPNKKMLFLGYPVHDVFYSDIPGDLSKLTTKSYKKTILWMPTFRASVDRFRNDSSKELPLGVPVLQTWEEYESLNTWLCAHDILLIIKIHPMQDLNRIKIKSLSNIMVLDGKSVKQYGVDNYRLMKDVDALISDYSSAATDFLHTDKPLAYTLDDVEDYTIGFIVENPKDLMAGVSIKTLDDLKHFCLDICCGVDAYKAERSLLFDKVHEYRDGSSCRRLISFLNVPSPSDNPKTQYNKTR